MLRMFLHFVVFVQGREWSMKLISCLRRLKIKGFKRAALSFLIIVHAKCEVDDVHSAFRFLIE